MSNFDIILVNVCAVLSIAQGGKRYILTKGLKMKDWEIVDLGNWDSVPSSESSLENLSSDPLRNPGRALVIIVQLTCQKNTDNCIIKYSNFTCYNMVW